MGVVQSLLKDNDSVIGIPGNHSSGSGLNNATTNNHNHNTGNNHASHPLSSDIAQSWVSNKLYKDLVSKFTELELLSLRQVLAHLKEEQEKAALAHLHTDTVPSEPSTATSEHAPQKPPSAPGITEETFVTYLGIPPEHSQAGKLFFRSFHNLSVYPDTPSPNEHTSPRLVQRDFIKPLALYCHKVGEGSLDVKPLKAIFESFAEPVVAQAPIKVSTTVDNIHNHDVDTEEALPLDGQGSLKKSKTMEDSLRDLTLQSNFEWNPEDDDFVDHGAKVKALDLVDVIGGLLWLIQKIIVDSPEGTNALFNNGTTTLPSPRQSQLARSKRAMDIVEHMIQYGRTSTHLHEPVDLTVETIDFGLFTKYISRNAPNLFEVLSPYFYGIFLIGNTMRHTETLPASTLTLSTSAILTGIGAGAGGAMVLPGISPIPALESPSNILTHDYLSLVSWFLPLQKTTPRLTSLYSGSKHGFSMNQFEVHVCKYPAPTLFLLLVDRQKTITPTMNRRKSISFGTTRHRSSISNSPPFIPYGLEGRRPSLDKLAGKSPISPTSGSMLNTIFDGVATTTEPEEGSTIGAQRNSTELGSIQVTPRRPGKERMVLGAYLTETWKVSKAGWGNDSFAVFELSPCFEVFPAKKKASTSSSSIPASRSSPHRTSPRNASPTSDSMTNRHFVHFLKNAGVGFGGAESESCMLYMDDNLRYGNYRQDFAGGNVYTSAGGARQSGFDVEFEQKEWDFEQREANRRASIHLRKDGEQDIDRDLLEMAGVIDPDRGHRHERHARRQSAM
ncbi:Restriction of telomere capping protein 5 [Podila verticillata]|nr:Restriction of telomere capping protein 5 [Podila verticillata]